VERPAGDPPETRLAYGIFQGGGARGFAHLGALQALEDLKFSFLGVAGTSAGAIVAAFAAVGYKSKELYDPDHPEGHVLAAFGSPIDLLGRRSWQNVKNARAAFSDRTSWFHLPRWMRRGGSGMKLVRLLMRDKGLLSSAKFIEVVNELLRRRLVLNYSAAGAGTFSEKHVRFKHVNRFSPNCTNLKIIVTDLARNRVVVYSSEDTPDVIVAEAVAASAAVPLLFRPVGVEWPGGDRGEIYVDGGLSSNLPIWVFSDEKRADARVFGNVPTIGFAFQERPVVPTLERLKFALPDLLLRIAAATLSTGQSVTQDFVEDLVVIPLPCRLSLLDIDAGYEPISQAYRAAYDYARDRLDFVFNRRPQAIRRVLEAFRADALRELKILGAPPDVACRVCAIEPVRSRYGQAKPRSFRVTESLGFENDTDDRLFLDAGNSGAPRAYLLRQPVVWESPSSEGGPSPAEHMTKYERALVRRTLRCALSIPVFDEVKNWQRPPLDRAYPTGIISIDSDADLRNYFSNTGFWRALVDKTVLLKDVFGK